MDGIDVGVLTQPAGPFHLPVWAYGAIGGGALLIISKLRKGAAANTAFGSGVQNPNYLPVATGSPAPSLLNPFSVGQNAAYDPNTGQIVESSNPFGTTFFDNLKSLITTSPNAPNNVTVTGPNGYMFTFGNNVATYGNGSSLRSGAADLAAVQGYWATYLAHIQGYWNTLNSAVNNGQQIGTPNPPLPSPTAQWMGGLPNTSPTPSPTPSPIASGTPGSRPGSTPGGR